MKEKGLLLSWGRNSVGHATPSVLSCSTRRSHLLNQPFPHRNNYVNAILFVLSSCFLLGSLRAGGQTSGVTPATLTPSSGTLSTSQTFTWSNGAGPTEYALLLGTEGQGTSNLYTLGATTATSTKVTIPANGVTVYATLRQLIDNAWQNTYYTFTEPGTTKQATLTPSSGTLSASQTFTWSNGAGPAEYELWLGTEGQGTANLYSSVGSAATSVTVTIPADGVTVYATLRQLIDDTWQDTYYTFTEPGTTKQATLTPSSGTLSASQTFTWSNGAGPAEYELWLGTEGQGTANLYNSGGTTTTSTTVTIPASGVTVYATLRQLIDDAWQATYYTFNEPVPVSALSCASGSMTGAGTDTCTVTLSPAAGANGQVVSLSSSATAVTVPSSVTVAAGATTASFTATVSAVSTAETATLTASSGGGTKTYGISLGASVPTLTLSGTSVSFGTVNVGGKGTGSVTLSSTGKAAVTVSAGSVSGAGYTISGVTFPLTLNAGQTATLGIAFSPTAAGAVSGTVTLTSNSSSGATSTISLSGTGQPVLSSLSCASGSMTILGTDTCTVTLNAAAGAGGEVVNLSSSLSAVTVPSTVTVAAGATTATFSATVTVLSVVETAVLSATLGGGAAQTFSISLGAATPTLTLQSTSVAFGDVTEGSPAYQSVTLTSSGTEAVTVSAGSVSGAGYTITGVSIPTTLNPGATASLEIEFAPTTAGASNGTVILTSNSSTGTTSTISLSGTGVASSSSYEVTLSWDAPTDSSDPVAGYNIYRAVSGSSTYQLLNSSVDSSTSYTDTTVATNTSYSYYVESVDAAGNQSAPSNTYTVSIP